MNGLFHARGVRDVRGTSDSSVLHGSVCVGELTRLSACAGPRFGGYGRCRSCRLPGGDTSVSCPAPGPRGELAAAARDTVAVEREPLAAASIPQARQTAMRTDHGEPADVVVKVQRSGTPPSLERDSDIIVRVAAALERRTNRARRLGVLELVRSYAVALRDEPDFRIEASLWSPPTGWRYCRSARPCPGADDAGGHPRAARAGIQHRRRVTGPHGGEGERAVQLPAEDPRPGR